MLSAISILVLSLSAPNLSEWPQWMGPTRDNVWHDTGIVDKFPAGGPKVLWRTPINGGYTGPAVAGGKVYIHDFKSEVVDDGEGNFKRNPAKGVERVYCLNVVDGKEIWHYDHATTYTISYPAGPRCTPLVHDGKVYTLGAMGHLACLDITNGKPVWVKDLTKEYGAKPAMWGYAAHPVIDGNKLITLGGINDNHIVALNKDTGAEIWKTGSQTEQGYSPVLFIQHSGVRQMIVTGPSAVRSYDPETGKRFWTQDYDASNGSIIMTPILQGDFLYIGGWQSKNLLLKLGKDSDGKPTSEKLWRNERGLGVSPVNVQPFLDNGILYGYHETGELFAVELPSGKRVWTSPGVFGKEAPGSGTAFLVKNGDRFFSFAETGELVICKLSKEKYEEIDRTKLIEPTGKAFRRNVVWCMPAYADKKMYVRNDKEIICVDLAKH